MDITAFIHNARQEALLLGDYNAYRSQCSRRLATIRKQLGRATKSKKYTAPEPLTSEDLSKDPK
jgi:signal recognition particle subunit SRP68